MKFEKLDNNKIRIIVTVQDLIDKNVDFHVFMSNPIESQNVLLEILKDAKKETGFDIEDYNIRIEALAMGDSGFIFTITKIPPEEKSTSPKRKFTVKRKNCVPNPAQSIFCFNNFDDFCYLLSYLHINFSNLRKLAKTVTLYSYKQKYYLLISNINNNYELKNYFFNSITEFATYINNSNVFFGKLKEYGKIVIKNNAFETGIKYFVE